MGSRTLPPTECEHGHVCDWGDFGPDPDDGTGTARTEAEALAQLNREETPDA